VVPKVLHKAFGGIFNALLKKNLKKTLSKIKHVKKRKKNVARIKNVKKRFFYIYG